MLNQQEKEYVLNRLRRISQAIIDLRNEVDELGYYITDGDEFKQDDFKVPNYVKLQDGTLAIVCGAGPSALTIRPLSWDKNKIDSMGGEYQAWICIGWNMVKEKYYTENPPTEEKS